MKITTIKLEEFSNCPGKIAIKQYLFQHNLLPYVNVVNVDDDFKNNRDTFVLEILEGPTKTQVALALGKMAVHFAADEFSWTHIDDVYVARIWWD